ncbi:hypothetical protein FRC01_001387 [Tulasnella sp. 417]|nr:hypothetical protein FRC01_001387 [Tulasnella sp. 417]
MRPPNLLETPSEEADDDSRPPTTPPRRATNTRANRGAATHRSYAVETEATQIRHHPDSNPPQGSGTGRSQRGLLRGQEPPGHAARQPSEGGEAGTGFFSSRVHHRLSISTNITKYRSSAQRTSDNVPDYIGRTTTDGLGVLHPRWLLGYNNSQDCAACQEPADPAVVLVCPCSRKHALCAKHFDIFRGLVSSRSKHNRDDGEESGDNMPKRSRRDADLGSHLSSQHDVDTSLGDLLQSPSVTPYVSLRTDVDARPHDQRLSYRDIGIQADRTQADMSMQENSIYHDAHSTIDLSAENRERTSPSPVLQTTNPNLPVAEYNTMPQGGLHHMLLTDGLAILPRTRHANSNLPPGGLPPSPLGPQSPLASSDLLSLSSFPSAQPRDDYYDTPPSFSGGDEVGDHQPQASDTNQTSEQDSNVDEGDELETGESASDAQGQPSTQRSQQDEPEPEPESEPEAGPMANNTSTMEEEDEGAWVDEDLGEVDAPAGCDAEWAGLECKNDSSAPALPQHPSWESLDPGALLKEIRDLQAGRLREFGLHFVPEQFSYSASKGRTAITTNSEEFTRIKAFKLQLEINLGYNSFHKLRRTFPELPLPSLKVLRREMQSLSGLSPIKYDMCLNSCMLYAGKYASLSRCMHCHHPRHRRNNKPFKQFHYLPFIPQIQALYANTTSANNMRYRHEHHNDNLFRNDGRISDVYDSALYRQLCKSEVIVGGERLGRKFFSDPRDVFVACMTDGFQIFKRAQHTAWPLILINMNLDPAIRYQWENIICVGPIPRPRKPKNFNSFTWVYTEELERAARGISTYDAKSDSLFNLHVYGPLGSGDMPAVASAFCCTKNHNAKQPCRFCPIEAVRIAGSRNPVHYVPMKRPADYPENPLTPNNLTTISHDEFLYRAKLVDSAPTVSDRKELAQLYGINTTPVMSHIPGVCFPWSFPFDFMHLLENLLKNYVKLLSGDFKGIPRGREMYVFSDKVWREIGADTVKANATIPSSFGRRIPNIAEDRTYFTAEAYLVWFTLYAPILLRSRFARARYYKHFLLLVSIINRCLAIVTNREERAVLRSDIVTWYEQYEWLFYQYKPSRLPTCLITVHAWLHLVDLMEQSGPLWGYWCWVMERYCSRLLRAVSSRKFPYTSLNRRILDTQTLLALRNAHELQEALPRYTPGHDSRIQNAWEDERNPQYSDLKVIGPSRVIELDQSLNSLRNRIAIHLMTRNDVTNRSLVLSCLPKKILQWAKIQIKDGDVVSSLHGDNREEDNQRITSYCQYELLVDSLAHDRTVAPVLDGRTFFGELERVFLLHLPRNQAIKQPKDEIILLLDIHSCKTSTDTYGFFEYQHHGPREVVDASALRAVVGRIKQGTTWTFVRRPGVFEHATYTYEDDE